jgi:hypothetical protein
MPGMLMFCVATLTQYWVTGVFAFSAAAAGNPARSRIAAVMVQHVFVRSFMVRYPPSWLKDVRCIIVWPRLTEKLDAMGGSILMQR